MKYSHLRPENFIVAFTTAVNEDIYPTARLLLLPRQTQRRQRGKSLARRAGRDLAVVQSSTREEVNMLCTLVLHGDVGVGKSSLFSAILRLPPGPVTGSRQFDSEGRAVHLHVWDSGPCTAADVTVVVYDITSHTTFARVQDRLRRTPVPVFRSVLLHGVRS